MTIAYTSQDFFGVFGPMDDMVTQDIEITGRHVLKVVFLAQHGDPLESGDQTLIDLLRSGF